MLRFILSARLRPAPTPLALWDGVPSCTGLRRRRARENRFLPPPCWDRVQGVVRNEKWAHGFIFSHKIGNMLWPLCFKHSVNSIYYHYLFMLNAGWKRCRHILDLPAQSTYVPFNCTWEHRNSAFHVWSLIAFYCYYQRLLVQTIVLLLKLALSQFKQCINSLILMK